MDKFWWDAKKFSVDKKLAKLNEKIFGKLILDNPNPNQTIISGSFDGVCWANAIILLLIIIKHFQLLACYRVCEWSCHSFQLKLLECLLAHL